MLQESNDLEKIQIFYEEVGPVDLTANPDIEEPTPFLEEVQPPQGLSSDDVTLLSQDLSSPDPFKIDPGEQSGIEQ